MKPYSQKSAFLAHYFYTQLCEKYTLIVPGIFKNHEKYIEAVVIFFSTAEIPGATSASVLIVPGAF